MDNRIPKKKELVEFRDGHCQPIRDVTDDLDGVVVWLNRRFPTDPDWVLSGDLIWLEQDNRWYHVAK